MFFHVQRIAHHLDVFLSFALPVSTPLIHVRSCAQNEPDAQRTLANAYVYLLSVLIGGKRTMLRD